MNAKIVIQNGIAFLMILLTSGCGESFQEPKPDFEANVSRIDFGVYSVNFEFNDDSEYTVQRIRNIAEKAVTEIGVAQASFSDDGVVSGATYTYKIGKYVDGTFKELIVKTIKIPYEVDSFKSDSVPQDFYQQLKDEHGEPLLIIDALLIRRKNPFYLNLQTGTIIIKNLISEDGALETSSTEYSAPYDVNGRKKGALNIEIQNGLGTLLLNLRGVGDGQPAPPQSLGEDGRGAQGAKGTNGIEIRETKYQLGERQPVCHTLIGKGGDGAKGMKGLRGLQGMNGGNSPFTKIKYNNSPNFTFSVSREGGKGSAGGLGGQGGPGGYPGLPGDVDIHYIQTGDYKKDVRYLRSSLVAHQLGPCALTPPAEFGPAGDTGDPGESGISGAVEDYCVFNSSQKNWECEK